MAQVSRPYQIALVVLALFAAVWFLALHRPGSGTSSSTGSPPSSSSAPSASAAGGGSPAASTPVYHGSAPGVEGLTRAINKAHGAVATSQQNARELQSKSAQASGESATTGASAATSSPATSSPATSSAATTGSAQAGATAAGSHRAGASATASHQASTTVRHSSATTTTTHRTMKTTPSHQSATAAANAQAARQAAVLQGELKRGQVVLLLFWNPKSFDDVTVRHEAQVVAAHLKGKVVLHVALANQVGQYGSVTRDVQVYQTPTLLIVNKRGLAVTLTGLVDEYSIAQGIIEAQRAKRGA